MSNAMKWELIRSLLTSAFLDSLLIFSTSQSLIIRLVTFLLIFSHSLWNIDFRSSLSHT